ncbi:MAG: hypothetical protein K8R09_01375, partial [Desulfobacterales bacterium]|nr:hypothetical protein [Desulfobacterales bacterium]
KANAAIIPNVDGCFCKRLYLFDYGDHWLFKVTKSRKKAQDPIQGIEYPRLIEEVGIKPEQYPSWEE